MRRRGRIGNGGGDGAPGGGGSGPTYTITGSVTGLAGSGLIVRVNSTDVAISANGTVTLLSGQANGTTYTVTVVTQPSAPAQVCTVTNASGTVSGSNVTNIAFPCTTHTHTIGGTVSGLTGSGLVLQNNGGDDFTATGDGAFAFATPIASGGTYNVTVRTQPRNPVQTCAVSNGTGTVADSSVTTPVITCATSFGRFAYVANSDEESISIYAVDAATGQLRARGYVETTVAPFAVTLDPSGRFLYASSGSSTVLAYRVNPASGELTEIDGSPFASGSGAAFIGMDPGGRFVYVANTTSHEISAYVIDGDTGALTPVEGSPFAAAGGPFAVSVHPGGRFAFVVNALAGNISTYAIAASTGALTLVGLPIGAGSTPTSLRIDPSGKFAYVTNSESDNVSAYTIDAVSGALTPVDGSPFPAGDTPWGTSTSIPAADSSTSPIAYRATCRSTGSMRPMAR